MLLTEKYRSATLGLTAVIRNKRNDAELRDFLISPFQLIYPGLEFLYLVPETAIVRIGEIVRIESRCLFEGREPCH